MARGYATVRGMKELTRDLRAVDRGLARELQKDLKAAVNPTVKLAKRIAPYDKGGLVKSIRPIATQKQVAIRANKRRKGFLYPAVYEYGGRRGGDFGPRAFLNPALNMTEDAVVKSIAGAISHFIARHDL
jgi:predicted PhzF superfamily epimerase YddE/YHI9